MDCSGPCKREKTYLGGGSCNGDLNVSEFVVHVKNMRIDSTGDNEHLPRERYDVPAVNDGRR